MLPDLDRVATIDAALLDRIALGLLDAPSPEAASLAAFLAGAFGPSTMALVHYGSHVTSGGARPGSALDFFVIVLDYAAAYESVVQRAETGMSARKAARLARRLPPNVVSVVDPASGLQAKCAVYSLADFVVAISRRSPDHFALGRLFQQVQVAWAQDEETKRDFRNVLAAIRMDTLAWGRPWLPARFDAPAYLRALLDRSFAAEIRPEKADRTAELLAGQAAVLYPAYEAVLAYLASEGELTKDGAEYRLVRPATAVERASLSAYFARSKVRATLRWAKYVALYDDWLDYVVKKVERRTGQSIALTPRERRWPLVFLWPRAIRFLRDRPQNRSR